ncbi:hypothetical protein MUK42_04238 [Musa troglodytarum]|uniref:Uncharacterized protein n=1 Tax=Musa troglodytarum TaxID=320322 RepID=A0A9E7GHQ8_9LILI|nr:hypothetical protein MUK42_04238 [Musa troglodytarum]
MSLQRIHRLILLLLVSSSLVHISLAAEAASIPFTGHEMISGYLESLGIKCQCRDGDAGECSSSWDSTCSKPDCHNMRF